MKRYILFILIFSLIWSSNELSELAKIPMLAVHFTQHLERNPKTSFMDFLTMHYFGKDIPDHDADQDAKLPFKTPGQHSCQVLFEHSFMRWTLPKPILKVNNFALLSPSYIKSIHIDKLYRPPKV